MRAKLVTGIFVTFFSLSACGQAARTPVSDRVADARIANEATPSNVPLKTPGQPRLSALNRNAQPSEVEQIAPLATFTEYDGRRPTDAIVPGEVPETAAKSSEDKVARKDVRAADAKKQKGKAEVAVRKTKPVRDDEKAQAKSSPVAEPRSTRQAARSVRKTPRPVRRPITASPRPARRPVAEVAVAAPQIEPVREPALPARPSIGALASSSLFAPRSSQDAIPTGLPDVLTAEGSIPLGTVPASLGVANLQAAEAAVPVADSLEQSKADDSGTLGWDDASALVRAGEVETAVDIGEFEVLMTLCSGRGVLTIQPSPGALEAIKFPKVVCGKTASLTSQ